jgi:hypothetical protein
MFGDFFENLLRIYSNVLLTYVKVYQYSETNVMQFLFCLLRIKGLYMFRALLAHPQEELHKRHLVYFVRVRLRCRRIQGADYSEMF